MTDIATKDFWIFRQKLLSTLLLLSHLVDYDFDNNDLDAVEYGLTGTSNKNIWWTYQLIGKTTIDLRFACDEDETDIIFIQLSFGKFLRGQVDLIIYVVQEFDSQHKHFAKQKL